MAANDHGYTKSGTSTKGGGGRSRGVALSTWLGQRTKGQATDYWVRSRTRGILDAMGLEDENMWSDEALAIQRGLKDRASADRSTKQDLGEDLVSAAQDGRQAQKAEDARERLDSAAVILDALHSATRRRERVGLDEGDDLDDPAETAIDGGGWSDEVIRGRSYRKHVNICIDNSGSTHMPENGFCSGPMLRAANGLAGALLAAAAEHEGVTVDIFSFNRITMQHTGKRGIGYRAMLAANYFKGIEVEDPISRDAVETNLAPLVEGLYTSEDERDLIGEPRIDIILTDGEFESDEDATGAAEWQRRRGGGVQSYVLNLCPDRAASVALPAEFRVIPLRCMTDQEGVMSVDEDGLRQALMQIVASELDREE